MAIYTISGLKQKIDEVLVSNSTGKITADKLADLMYDIVDTTTASGSTNIEISGSATVTGSLFVSETIYINGLEVSTQQYVDNAISGNLIPVLQQSLNVELGSGVDFGGVSTGDTFTSGSSIENVIRTLLIKEINPTYTQPSTTIASNVSFSSREVGEVLNPTFTLSYTQNDAGIATHYILRKNGVDLSSVTASSSPQNLADLSVQVTNSAITYVNRVNYLSGSIKNTNLGNPYPTGQIPAGYKDSSALTILGYRKGFYGTVSTPSPTAPSLSSDIRGLASSILNPNNLSTFTINIPAGATMVVFAYPNTLTTPNSVLYVEGGSVDVKGIFTEISISVEGANGYTPIPYRVYYYIPVSPFASSATYNVTI